MQQQNVAYKMLQCSDTVLYSLVFLFNIGPEIFLCNVREICAMLAQPLQQPVIIKKLTGPK